MAGYLRMRRQLMRSRGGYSAEALALFAAMSSPPPASRMSLIDRTIRSLISAGLWELTDPLWVMAAHDSQAARLNWKSPGTFTLTDVGTGPSSFTVDRGFDFGDSTSNYLTTGWDAATNAVQLAQNSAHIGAYFRETSADLASDVTDFGSDTLLLRIAAGNSGQVISRITSTTNIATTGGIAVVSPAHIMGIRRTATDVYMFVDGTENNNDGANASAALSISDIVIGRAENRQIAALHLGAALSDAQALAYYNILHTYAVAVGADT